MRTRVCGQKDSKRRLEYARSTENALRIDPALERERLREEARNAKSFERYTRRLLRI